MGGGKRKYINGRNFIVWLKNYTLHEIIDEIV